MAGREVALGASSAGWLKSGMALRMVEELGLERDAFVNLEDVPDQDRETVYMRQRTFWSAYSWDKYVPASEDKLKPRFFAMTLGRQPAMHRTIAPSRVPHCETLIVIELTAQSTYPNRTRGSRMERISCILQVQASQESRSTRRTKDLPEAYVQTLLTEHRVGEHFTTSIRLSK